MNDNQSDGRNWLRASIIGLAVSVLTAAFMIVMFEAGIAPFPKPPSLAFAETLLSRQFPVPIGLLFHTAYVTAWSVIYIRFSPQRNLKMALALSFVLWLVILAAFFPFVGWGFAGMQISPKLIPASLIPHLLFGLLLWGLDKYAPRKSAN
jgi:hypothetical protein